MKKAVILKIIVALTCLCFLTGAVLTVRVVFYPDWTHRIAPGVTVDGVSVGDMTAEHALSQLKKHKKFQSPAEYKLIAGNRQFDIKLSELKYEIKLKQAVDNAFHFSRNMPFNKKVRTRFKTYSQGHNISVKCSWDQAAMDSLIALVASKIDRDPVNALMDWDTMAWSEHTDGLSLDQDEARAAMAASMNLYNGFRVPLPVKVVPARITARTFENIDFKNPLGTYQTKFSEGKTSRAKNLRRIAELLTGYEIKPGEKFSYNETVGERTSGNGFYLAPVIENGRIEQGWGGGVCQPSSTLFNAALLAGLDEFDWMPHSRTSSYIDPGRDATVAYGSIDLSFRNPHPNSVFVFATATQGIFTVSLFSEFKPDYKIEVRSTWWGRFWPGEKVTVDKNLAPGKRVVDSSGASGMSAALYRKIIYPDGSEKEERMSNKSGDVLHYRGAKRIVRVGPPES